MHTQAARKPGSPKRGTRRNIREAHPSQKPANDPTLKPVLAWEEGNSAGHSPSSFKKEFQ